MDTSLLSKLSHHPDFVTWAKDNSKCSCGAEKAWFDFIPDWILLVVSIVLACCIHDHRYSIGGSEADKIKSDRELMNNILNTIDDYGEKHRFFPSTIARYRAVTYYNGVILGGKKAFNFREKEVEDGSSNDQADIVSITDDRGCDSRARKQWGSNGKHRVRRHKSKRGV